MTTIYLIRHGEAEGNLYRRAHGQYDSTITDNGYRQIAALARRMRGVPLDAVYASDLTRTQTTALAVTRTHDLPLRLEPRFREVNVGVWEDRTWAWLARFDTARLVAFNSDAQNWQVEGGETMMQVRDRMLAALRDVIAAHPGQRVAVVSHGMALRALVGTLKGMTLRQIDGTGHAENTAVTKLEADERGIRLVYENDASHLSEELTTLHKQLWTKSKGGLEPGIWFAPEDDALRFSVRSEDARVGALALVPGADGVADVTELWLDEALRHRNLGVRLVGQAMSCARAHGCDTLRVDAARCDDEARRRLTGYGFSARDGALVKYVGFDPAYRIARFDAALRELDGFVNGDGSV